MVSQEVDKAESYAWAQVRAENDFHEFEENFPNQLLK